jgi:hypothetical protein
LTQKKVGRTEVRNGAARRSNSLCAAKDEKPMEGFKFLGGRLYSEGAGSCVYGKGGSVEEDE